MIQMGSLPGKVAFKLKLCGEQEAASQSRGKRHGWAHRLKGCKGCPDEPAKDRRRDRAKGDVITHGRATAKPTTSETHQRWVRVVTCFLS